MKKISLTRGYEALVDDDDFDSLDKYKWFVMISHPARPYAARKRKKSDGPGATLIFMHRVVTGLTFNSKKIVPDHINKNTLDNRKENLRVVTGRINQLTGTLGRRNKTSQYNGVCWYRAGSPGYPQGKPKWVAQITTKQEGQYKIRNLGYFEHEGDAARAYDSAATELFGEFARLNFPGA